MAISLYSLLLIYTSVKAYKKPFYNGDILSYSALILKIDNPADTNVKLSKMQLLKKEIPAKRYEQLVANANSKSQVIKKEYDHLPFYIVKPLYILACFVFYKLGVSLAASTVCPSVFAYIAIAIIMMTWLHKYYSSWLAAIFSGVVISWDTFVNMARLSTPDTMSALFIFAAAYYLIEKKSFIGTYIMIVFAVFCRLDNLLPAIGMLTIMLVQKYINVKQYFIAILGLVFIFLILGFIISLYGWNFFFLPSYLERLNPSGKANKGFDVQGYLELLRLSYSYALNKSHIFKFIVLMCVYLLFAKAYKMEKLLVATLLIVVTLRFFLHPLTVDRFYFGYYLIGITLIIKSFYPGNALKTNLYSK